MIWNTVQILERKSKAMIKELSFEIIKKDDKGNPMECKLVATGDYDDLHKAYKELSLNVLKMNSDPDKK